ncbi:hypothetical protein SprV_1002824100 [Sparganum proliferum]
MMTRVTDNGAVSEAFAVTNGVKQGCVLVPTLFSLMFSAMLMDAYRDERPAFVHIAYRTDGHLLNQRRMHFQSRVSKTTVHELLLAGNCALNTTSEEEMQRSMDLFSAACENFGLVINTQKTVVMHQLPPLSTATAPPPPPPPQIGVNGTQLHLAENFPHLGSTLSRSTKIDDEVARRIPKVSQAFGRLHLRCLHRIFASPSFPSFPPPNQRERTQQQVVVNFPYLGSTLSRSTKIDDEVARTIPKVRQAFSRLRS